MTYTIKQVSQKLDLTAYTLRYYEREGLLPFVGRDNNGNRIFNDHDIDWLILIRCLRDTGMSVAEIKGYVSLCMEGDSTIEIRKQIMLQHKRDVERRIALMNGYLAKINKKLDYYDNFIVGQDIDCCNPKSKAK